MSTILRLNLVVALFWFAQYVYIPYTAPFLLAQKAGADLVGLIVGVYGAMQMLLRLPAGLAADMRFGNKKLMVLGCFCAAAGSVLRVLWPDSTGFLLGNVLSGTASATWAAFVLFYVQQFPKDKMQQAMGQIFGANNGGIAVAFVVSTFCYQHIGMRALCALSLLSAAVALLIALTLQEHSVQPKSELPSADKAASAAPAAGHTSMHWYLGVLLKPELLFFAGIAALQQGILMGSPMSFAPEMLQQHGLSDFMTGWVSVFYVCCATLSCYLASTRFIARVGPAVCMTVSMLSVIFYCIAIVWFSNLLALFLIQICMGFSSGLVFSWCNSEALKNVEAGRRSTALGSFQSIYGAGMTIIPLLAGWCAAAGQSLSYAFYVQAAFGVLAVVLILAWYAWHKIRRMQDRVRA